MGVAENLAAVRERVERACGRVGRDPGEVRIMAVTKTHPAELIREAYAAGVRLVGENRVQEAAEKVALLADLPDLRWALIGHLQTNKAAQAAALADEFHAVDSLKVAAALDRRLAELGRTLNVYIQVNSSDEPQKFGLPPDAVEPFVHDLARFDSLRVRGLMTLAVFSDDEGAVRACFERVHLLRARLLDTGAPGSFGELSMGMSGDFDLAVEYGATTVRIGQALFGARPPQGPRTEDAAPIRR